MNNIIEFRGMRTDGKGMAYGMLMKKDICRYLIQQQHVKKGVYYEYHEIIPETIGQRIADQGFYGWYCFYIGDLVKDNNGNVYEVVINDNIPCLKNNEGNYILMTNDNLRHKEVIGNIHENKKEVK